MRIVVIGSGPSGVHFAQTALAKGHAVLMLDVGAERPPITAPEKSFSQLKAELEDSVEYFVGGSFSSAVLPPPDDADSAEYYGFPPSKDYIFKTPENFRYQAQGFEPLTSFAAGGLAETWTGGSYPLIDAEMGDFPFGEAELAPHYAEVARRIGVGGAVDDLGAFLPGHDGLREPIELDESSRRLLSRYEQKRDGLVEKHRARMGRSRQAALSNALGAREGCRRCGRCLWGCPNGAFYTPSLTLNELKADERFEYRSGLFVSHFELGQGDEIEKAVAFPLNGGAAGSFSGDAYVLAAGTVSSANIFLRSLYSSKGEIAQLRGLTDNRQILAPFFNLEMLGRAHNAESYQYHQLAMCLETDDPKEFVHGQITTVKTATAHPIVSSLPLDLRGATSVFRALRSGLSVLNLNFSDTRRDENFITLAPPEDNGGGAVWPRLKIRYAPPKGERKSLKTAMKRSRRFFQDLGAPLIPGMSRIRPMGASVHYSGTLPMTREKRELSVSASGQSYDFSNLYVIDGSVMPFLPAKNLTFTLMANATRIAHAAF